MSPYSGSVHIHSTFCDGRDTPEAMAAAAYAAGVRYFGFSSHSHTPIPADCGFVLPSDLTAYKDTVYRLRKEYAGRMEILLGIELDSCSDVEPWGFDYWIGSVHYLKGKYGGYYAVDWDKAQFAACRDTCFGGDALAMVESYFDAVAQMAARKPSILGHIDLIRKFNRGNHMFDEAAPRYTRAALQALHVADPQVTLLEINTGAISRGLQDTPYPALFLLREWRKMGGRVILTSDAHGVDTITAGYAQAAETAKAAGFTCAVLLTMAGNVDYPLSTNENEVPYVSDSDF